jgi:hypothetical protein
MIPSYYYFSAESNARYLNDNDGKATQLRCG